MASTDRRHRAGAWLLAGLIALFAACGGGGPSAAEVAVQWRQALEKGDYERTWDLEGPNLRHRAGKAVDIASRKEDRFGQPLSPGAASESIKAVRTDQPTADPNNRGDVWIYLEVQTKDPDRNHLEAVGLRQIGGQWRVERREPSVPHVGWVR